jgi:hypothetical protein
MKNLVIDKKNPGSWQILQFLKTSSLVRSSVVMLCIALNLKCGGAPSGEYYPNKTYGATTREQIAGSAPQGATPPPGEGGGDGTKGGGDGIKGDEDGEPKETPGDTPDSPDNEPTDKPTGDKGPTPPDTEVRKLEFKVVFDSASAVGLRNNQPNPVPLNGIIGQNVRSRLVAGPEDGMMVTDQYGDGKGKFASFINLRNSLGDANRHPNAPSISSLRSIFVQATSQGCPTNVFNCAERILLAPLQGKTETLCFTDPATGKPAAYPTGPKSDVPWAELEPKLGTFGPFNVRVYPGDVPCEESSKPAPAGPYFTETITAKISKASLDNFTFLLHKNSPVMPSFGVVFENNRTQGDLVSPYLDETSRLPGKATYFINEPQKLMVKTIVRSRLSLDIARLLGGGIFAGFIDQLINLDGVTVDLHYEMCKDLLNPKEPNHCPVPPAAK